MTQSRDMFIIEWPWFIGKRFRQLDWKYRLVYITIWGFFEHESTEKFEFVTKDALISQIHLWNDVPLKIIEKAMDEIYRLKLAAFDDGNLMIYGVREKHRSKKTWVYSLTDEEVRVYFDPQKGVGNTPCGVESNPNTVQESDPTGVCFYPGKKQYSRRTLTITKERKENPEIEPVLSNGLSTPIEQSTPRKTKESAVAFDTETRQLLKDIIESYNPIWNGSQVPTRMKILARRFCFSTESKLEAVAKVERERLVKALVYVFTNKVRSLEGTVFTYAIELPTLPKSAKAKVEALTQELLNA